MEAIKSTSITLPTGITVRNMTGVFGLTVEEVPATVLRASDGLMWVRLTNGDVYTVDRGIVAGVVRADYLRSWRSWIETGNKSTYQEYLALSDTVLALGITI